MDQAAATVWEYPVAFEQVPLWEHSVSEVRQLTPGDPVVGTAISARRMYVGRETHLEGEIRAIEPGGLPRSPSAGPHVESLVTYSVEPLGEGRSRVTYSAPGSLQGPLRLLQPILPAVGRGEARNNLVKLERRIAAGIPPRADTPTPDA